MSIRNPKKKPPVYALCITLFAGLQSFAFFAPDQGWSSKHFLAAICLLAITAFKLLRITTQKETKNQDRLEAGLLLILSTHLPIQGTGGVDSYGISALYITIALLTAYSSATHATIYITAAILLPCLGTIAHESGFIAAFEVWGHAMTAHFIATISFATIVGAFVKLEKKRRMDATAQLNRFQTDTTTLAEELSSDLDPEPSKPALHNERDRRMRDAIRGLDKSLFNALHTAHQALDAHSIIYFRYDANKNRLRIRQMVTQSDHVIEDTLDARQAGILTGVLKCKTPVTLSETKKQTLPYYTRNEGVQSVIAVPIMEESTLRGILLADAKTAGALNTKELSLLNGFAATIAELEKDARERELHAMRATRLALYFDTSKRLASSLALEEVLGVAMTASQELAEFDFAAIVESTPDGTAFTIRKVSDNQENRLTGQEVTLDGSLVGWVIKNKQYLPVRQFHQRERKTPLFTKKLDPSGIRSAIVFPLAREGQAVGALVVASLVQDEFGQEEIQLLEGIANQTGLAMANAILYSRMQEMATTDGLTGLSNHRFFQVSMSKEIERAKRQELRMATILIDVDHFKRVNDVYGHPVGDDVLRKIAEILKDAAKRAIDIPARYGGEEFVLILPDTDLEGAKRVADEIRQRTEKEVFDGGEGREFRVTLSAGISIYPSDGSEKQTLIDRADKSLYHSKESGRNKTTAWSEITGSNQQPQPTPTTNNEASNSVSL